MSGLPANVFLVSSSLPSFLSLSPLCPSVARGDLSLLPLPLRLAPLGLSHFACFPLFFMGSPQHPVYAHSTTSQLRPLATPTMCSPIFHTIMVRPITPAATLYCAWWSTRNREPMAWAKHAWTHKPVHGGISGARVQNAIWLFLLKWRRHDER